jgi:hypothetical protein
MPMTEQEWLACTDPKPMLAFLRRKVSDRKLRLFACAYARRNWHLLGAASQKAIDVAERYADGQGGDSDLHEAQLASASAMPFAARGVCCSNASDAAEIATHTGTSGQRVQADILRDIFGPRPFRPVTLNPAWQMSNVIALAQSIYDERAFDRLPILADALEDAGCDNADILNHCRQPGEHVRGCWVADLLLGKE